jgi:hypothetical protein
MLQALGLGDPIDISSGNNRGFNAGSVRAGGGAAALLSAVPTLSDHPLAPLFPSDVRLFTAGLVVERTHTASLPMMICMEQHVAEMWTLDAADCVALAEAQVPSPTAPPLRP